MNWQRSFRSVGGGNTALNAARIAIKADQLDCVLAIGTEKINSEDRAKTMEGFLSGTDVEVTMQLIAQFQEQEKKRKEEQAKLLGEKVSQEKPGGHSSFMDLYAMGARMHMERYGSTQR